MKRFIFILVVVISCDLFWDTSHYEISGEIFVDDTVYVGMNEGKIAFKLYVNYTPFEGELLLDLLQMGPPGPIRYDTIIHSFKMGEGTLPFSFEIDTYAVEVTFNLWELKRDTLLDTKTSLVLRR
jgi:hypothetical protein